MTKYRIKSIAKYLPGKAISAQKIEQSADMPNGWVMKNSGVAYRYRAGESDSVIKMGAKALATAFTQAGINMSDVQQLIFASGTYDYPIPYNACLLKKEMQAEDALTPCFDIDATCLSFLTAFDVGLSMMHNPDKQRLALVTSEISSRSLNIEDFKTYSLFGDAAVACILEKGDGVGSFSHLGSVFENYCEGADLAKVEAGGNVLLGNNGDVPKEKYFFNMQGRKLVQLTFKYLDSFIKRVEIKTGFAIQDFDHVVPHQASKFGNALFAKKYNLRPDQVHNGLERYGNCISASIALGLEEVINKKGVKPGEKVLLTGTAAGLSLGAVALQF
jgi:3-oxoacyl-[acyl-carrier-protein] synthase-3